MATYKRLVLYNILTDLYPPSVPIACDTTYSSITLYNTDQPLVSEQTIIDLYPSYVQKYNVGVLRQERGRRLMSTDMYGLADYPFKSDDDKQAWFTYRQALRDITNVYLNPEVGENDNLIGITWPEKPTS
jgi:hypothetical protein